MPTTNPFLLFYNYNGAAKSSTLATVDYGYQGTELTGTLIDPNAVPLPSEIGEVFIGFHQGYYQDESNVEENVIYGNPARVGTLSNVDGIDIEERLDNLETKLQEICDLIESQTPTPSPEQPFHSGLVVTGPVGYEAPETDRYFQCVTPLGYTDYRSIEDLYGHLGLENILNDNDQEVEPNGLTHYENVVNAAIVDAEQTISLRLSPWFTKEQLVGDQWIWSRSRWIAAYYLSQRRGNEHYFEAKYQEVMRELDAIATGEIAPPSCIPLRANSLPSMSNLEIDDSFFLHKTRVQSTISVGGTYPGQDINYYYGFFFGAI